MEQRNGRIDRHGQRAKQVSVFHFVGKGYKQREKADQDIPAGDLEGDLEFLMRAAKKVEQIREDLGKVGPVIAQQVEEAMLGHRAKLNTAVAEKDAEPAMRMLKFERDLRQQIERLRDQLQETKRTLRLDPENVQKVVEVALQLADQPPLIPAEVDGIWPSPKRAACPVFHLPAFKGSWSYCTEGLRQLHTDEIRPVVFDPALAQGRDDVVLAHLNHRLVQMCLRLLRAEVWSTEGKKKLHRITARTVPDSVLRDPAMVAHARLVVIGGDSARLHEEIITAGGLLTGGKFKRMNVGDVRQALDSANDTEPPQSMKNILTKLYPEHLDSLAKSLEARMRDRLDGMTKLLAEREAKEVGDITFILTELRKSIEEKLDDSKLDQLVFDGWVEDERRQLERNMDALRVRVREIPAEIERETEAVRRRFADPSTPHVPGGSDVFGARATGEVRTSTRRA